ncbi:DEAD/DEAH box helicase family protein [Nocardia nepalensis]|uniref:DEAD/DEAH box helicase family protein n=1 Tax=Nocardia nepalensis TaxID=3375448 RepID=UPI003B673C4F
MDANVVRLAKASPNFGRLFEHSRLLAIYGAEAEALVFVDANGALVHTRQFGEVLAELLITRSGLRVAGNRQVDRLVRLRQAGFLSPTVDRQFDTLRRAGNRAAHAHSFDRTSALEAIQCAFELGRWYGRIVANERSVVAFVPPIEPPVADHAERAELAKTLAEFRQALIEAQVRLTEHVDVSFARERAQVEAESQIAKARQVHEELRAQVDTLKDEIDRLRVEQQKVFAASQARPASVSASDRELMVERALRPPPLNEVQARVVIDSMLIKAGWVVQDLDALNPLAGHGVAVRELRLASGPADYVLYVDGRIVGVVEAKREGETLAAAQAQNARYATGVLDEYALAVWKHEEPLPFRYATTGVETVFCNRLDPVPSSRTMFGFHRPETIADWMRQANENRDAPTYRARLRLLPDLDKQGLRLAQIEAITGLEDSLARDRPRALIQMATGAGKTFTAVTETYRLLKYGKAVRVLFLVDRNNLGKQALAEFRNYVTPDDGRKFSEIYNVERLSGHGIKKSSSVVIGTIQKMYAVLRGETVVVDDAADDEFDELDGVYGADAPVEVGYNPDVPPESFDLIIVDECHRSIYGLWRGVLEYFDAHIVGLTATPTKQTFGFFGQNLVSEYSYPMAVADGVNVDFQLVKLQTKIGMQGSSIDEGTTVRRRDRRTRAQRLEQLDDDFTYGANELGRAVIADDHIRTTLAVWRDSWQSWFPGRKAVPKTLIFAADDNHADDIVRLAKEVFFNAGDDFIQKITYKVRNAGIDPDDLINDLRNSPHLRMAVTVDMIATGTDIRALECLIFLRQVRSAVLFEQMKGRGARTLDPVELAEVTPEADELTRKDQFVLIDTVGITDSPLVDSTPLSAPVIGDAEKRLSMKKLLGKAASGGITADEARELAGRLARLDRRITDDDRAELSNAGGVTLAKLARGIVEATSPDAQAGAADSAAAHGLIADAVRPLTINPDFRERILAIRREYDITYDETSRDEVLNLTTVSAADRAAELVESWRGYLKVCRDEIMAIPVVSNERAGGQGAYSALKDVAARVRHSPYSFTPAMLWDAYQTLGKTAATPGPEAGIPDLVSLIRFELGADDKLCRYRTLVEERFEAWLLCQHTAGVAFTNNQIWWLERIRDTVAVGVGITTDDLSGVTFAQRGGTVGLVNAFGGKDAARSIVNELDRELA